MKVQASIRSIFDVQKALNTSLEEDVRQRMLRLREPRWHFESRVKELESFAAKVETGRVTDPEKLEDFLACTVVVPNTQAIPIAVARVKTAFEVRYQRPRDLGMTTKQANAFPFDDLRLYCVRGNDGSLPAMATDRVVFEVQVKTFLQHAWTIATHDLNYKTDDIRWGKDRIVAHLKAAVEHAELSLMEAEALSKSKLLQLSNRATDELVAVVATLTRFWKREELPSNLRGLASSLVPLLTDLRLSASDLSRLLESERVRVGGALPMNLSPYGVVVQALCNGETANMDAALKRERGAFRLVLTPEISLPPGFPSGAATGRVVQIA